MNKFVDLTGQKFGKLTVKSFFRALVKDISTPNGFVNRIHWQCVCDCGKEQVALTHTLRSGNVKSCGCLSRIPSRSKQKLDIIGKKFGSLTVLSHSYTKNYKYGRKSYWLCQCNCGKNTTVVRDSLISGITKSCGCINFDDSTISNGKFYKQWNSIKRREIKKTGNCFWTLEMHKFLRQLQPNCVVCGSNYKLQVDHIYALSSGYNLMPGNAVVLCRQHNRYKSDKSFIPLPFEFKYKIVKAADDFLNKWLEYNGGTKLNITNSLFIIIDSKYKGPTFSMPLW